MGFFIKKANFSLPARESSDVKSKNFIHIFLLCLISCLSFSACENRSGRYAADDLVLSHFVNKSFIFLLGRKPYDKEMEQARSFFEKNGFTQSSRRAYLLKVSTSDEYKLYLYQLARNDLMNFIFNPDSAEIQTTIDYWAKTAPNEKGRKEVARLKKLQTISADLLNGRLDNIGLQKRLVHNSYYDFINMGTENFVVSMYNTFLDRPPTKYELMQGKKMVDSSDAIFLGFHGHSKEDFIALFFDSYPYYEGQARILYKRYYFCEPKAEYLAYLTLEYYRSRDYRKLQVEMLSADEFITS